MLEHSNRIADRLVNFFGLANSIPELKRRLFIVLMAIGVVLLLFDIGFARVLGFDWFTVTSDTVMILFLTAMTWLLVRSRERQELILVMTFLGSAIFLLIAMYYALSTLSAPGNGDSLMREASPWFVWFILLDMACFLTFRASTALRLSLIITVVVILLLGIVIARDGALQLTSLHDFLMLFSANLLVIFMAYPLAQSQERIAQTDFLTGLANRSRGYSSLETQIERAQRYDELFSVVLFDLDHFKKINDMSGHPSGDVVLCQVSAFVEEHMRRTDLVCRWGGEEFLLLMPHTDLASATLKAEYLRQQLKSRAFNRTAHLTASFGVTTYYPYDTTNSLLERVDRALYRAKRNGRNCVESE